MVPSLVSTVRSIHEDFELAKLSGAYTLSEEVRFKFYLMSGFRDAEGRFVNRLAESATLGPANAHARCQGGYQSGSSLRPLNPASRRTKPG
jgi:hypothetical protein